MSTSNAPRASDWAEIVEALHSLTNTMTVRSHYGEGHPAIVKADHLGSIGLGRLLARLPEIVVALIDGEFVICERPLPELRTKLHVLAEAMIRHDIECIVLQRGVSLGEVSTLARALSSPIDVPGVVRASAQTELVHVLLRFVELKKSDDRTAVATSAIHFVPRVSEALTYASEALPNGGKLDRDRFRSIARDILSACGLRAFVVTERAWTRTLTELATHATNVAMIAGAMAIEAGLPDSICVDLVAAALLHDIGHLLLPVEIRGLPEPLVDEKNKALFRNHGFAGASALLGAGAPPLWIAAALEHHRGLDGGGYPALDSAGPPHELVRIVALANFFDRKRTLLDGRAMSPEDVLRQATELGDKYFGRPVVEHFTRALGVFPPGTTVELSDRQPALVVSANPNDPWRPRVLVLRGPDADKRIDLREIDAEHGRHQLSIVRAIPPPLLVRSELHAEAADPAVAQAQATPTPPPTPMSDWLDGLVTPRAPVVTSPPPRSSAPPTSTPRISRPIVVQEIVATSLRGYSEVPSRRPSGLMVPPKITVPPLAGPKAPKIEQGVGAPGELRLSSIVRRTGAVPAALDHRGAFVLGFVDGGSSLEDILDMSGLPKADLFRIVGELVDSGTIALD